MRMLTRRVHLLLDEDRYRRVSTLAKQRRVSVATVIREAIDHGLVHAQDRRRAAALRDILEADPMDVPETVEELKAELDEMRSRHAVDL